MKTLYICNAFSLQMLAFEENMIRVTPVPSPAAWLENVEPLFDILHSAVGHADTAAIFSSVLNMEVKENRTSISMSKDIELLVGQYSGPRLPEGATTLPQGATIKWFHVKLV